MTEADRRLIVAIDGPSAAGKTTVGTLVAERLGAIFLDTGVLYRSLTLLALESGVSADDERRLSALAGTLDVHVRQSNVDDGRLSDILLGERDITWDIRSADVDQHVSQVASYPGVRTALIPVQRGAVAGPRAVVVGRDIGTVIFPDAEVKVYLEASVGERAARRARQQGGSASLDEIARALAQRDELDRGREVAPLTRAPDAIVMQTDGIPIEEVVERVCRIALERSATGG